MFAIAFDLDTKALRQNHPSQNHTTGYADIRRELLNFGFEWRQGSLYTTNNDDMANLFAALMALRALPWFPPSVRDIRAFKVEQWSDFTKIVKGGP